jgi:hypothetical protein
MARDRTLIFLAIINLALLALVKPVRDQVGIIEGQIWPVSTPLTVTHVEADPRGVRIHGNAPKMRDCDYRGVEWRFGTVASNVPIAGGFDDPPAVNEVASGAVDILNWDGIWAAVSPSQVGGTIAYAWHQCPGRWWETRTLWHVGNTP